MSCGNLFLRDAHSLHILLRQAFGGMPFIQEQAQAIIRRAGLNDRALFDAEAYGFVYRIPGDDLFRVLQ